MERRRIAALGIALAGLAVVVALSVAGFDGPDGAAHARAVRPDDAHSTDVAPPATPAAAPLPNAARAAPEHHAPEPLIVTHPECAGVLATFEQQRDRLRRLHDEALARDELPTFLALLDERAAPGAGEPPAPTPPAGTTDTSRPAIAGGLLGARLARLPTTRRLDAAFADMRECAQLVGLSDALELLVIDTLAQEVRPPLQDVWLGFLASYDTCDRDVFGAVHAFLREHADQGLPPSTVELLRDAVTLAASCDALRDEAFLALLSLLPLVDDSGRDILWSDIAATQPYTLALGRTLVDAMKDDAANRFGVMEALRSYAARGDAVLQDLFESEPELVERLLVEGAGGTDAWVFCEMVGQHGGPWGVDLVLDHVRDPSLPAEARAAMLGVLGDAPDMPWSGFRELLGGGPAIDAAAYGAIGQKARDEPAALDWLRAQALSGDVASVVGALGGLAAGGVDDLAEFVRRDVLPGATGEARGAALRVYVAQPDADPAWLASMTDPAHEHDGDVRLQAAIGHLLVTRDLDTSLDLVESMTDDPDADVRFAATLILDEVLAARDDDASRRRRSQLDTPAYQLKRLAVGVDPEELLDEVLVGGDPGLTALMVEHMQGTAAGIAMEQRAYLASLLRDLREP